MQPENHTGQEIRSLRNLSAFTNPTFYITCRIAGTRLSLRADWIHSQPCRGECSWSSLRASMPHFQGCKQRILSAEQRQEFRVWKTSPLRQLLRVLGGWEGACRPGEQWENQYGWSIRCKAACGWSIHLPFGIQSSCWHGNCCKINSRWYFRWCLGDCPGVI